MKTVIIDVGAYDSGIVTRDFRRKHNVNYPIIFIEPDMSVFPQIPLENSNDIKLPIVIHNYDGEVDFNFYQTGTHSVLKTNLEEIHKFIDGYSGRPGRKEDWIPNKIVKIPCLRLDSLLTQHNIDKVYFLKIDTQGSDFDTIKSLGDRIKDVKYILCEVQVTEFEVYINGSKKQDVMDYMNLKGFNLIKSDYQTYNQEENLLFINTCYTE